MSTLVELVKSFYEDDSKLFGALAPDVVWHETEGFPYGGIYKGVDAIFKAVFSHLDEDWENFAAHAEKVMPAGENAVLSYGYYSGIARNTGKKMKAAFAHLYTFENGQVSEFRQFGDSLMFSDPLSEQA